MKLFKFHEKFHLKISETFQSHISGYGQTHLHTSKHDGLEETDSKEIFDVYFDINQNYFDLIRKFVHRVKYFSNPESTSTAVL